MGFSRPEYWSGLPDHLYLNRLILLSQMMNLCFVTGAVSLCAVSLVIKKKNSLVVTCYPFVANQV